MRQVLLGDVVAAARALMDLPPSERAAAIARMIDQAHCADKFTKRTGRPHKCWGNGSLMAAAVPKPKTREPFLSDPAYIQAMQQCLAALLAWKLR